MPNPILFSKPIYKLLIKKDFFFKNREPYLLKAETIKSNANKIVLLFFSIVVSQNLFAAELYSSFCSDKGYISEKYCGDKVPNQNWQPIGSQCYRLDRKELCDNSSALQTEAGCSQLSIMSKIAIIARDQFNISLINAVKNKACLGKYKTGYPIYYQNGRMACKSASDQDVWYYPNGQKMNDFNINSFSSSFYYPEGELITNEGSRGGGRWYYKQQGPISERAGLKNATYYREYSGYPYQQSPAFVDSKNTIQLNLYLDYLLNLNGLYPKKFN